MPKTLKAKTGDNKIVLEIDRIHYIKSMTPHKDILEGEELINPIEVKIDKHTGVMGAGGVPYAKKHFCVYRGSRRVTTAIKLGYTHIEGVIID